MTIALDANFRDEYEDNKLRCETVDQCQARQSEWCMEQQTPKPCVSCVQGPCISDMALCRNRQGTVRDKKDTARRTWSTLLDLWHWDIINLFGQHVVGCDSRGSTNAGFRKVSLVLKSPTYKRGKTKTKPTSGNARENRHWKACTWKCTLADGRHTQCAQLQRDNMTLAT